MNESKKNQDWFVYIIEAENGYLYTGITTCLEKRFSSHSLKKTGAKFFHFSKPKQIVYVQKLSSRSEASKQEAYIKSLSKLEKLALIQKYHD